MDKLRRKERNGKLFCPLCNKSDYEKSKIASKTLAAYRGKDMNRTTRGFSCNSCGESFSVQVNSNRQDYLNSKVVSKKQDQGKTDNIEILNSCSCPIGGKFLGVEDGVYSYICIECDFK